MAATKKDTSTAKTDAPVNDSNTNPNDDISADLANATTNLSSGDANENIPVTSAQLPTAGQTADTEGQA